jgi:hypothetical protein
LLEALVFRHLSMELLLHEVAVAAEVLTTLEEAVLVALEVVEHIPLLAQPILAVVEAGVLIRLVEQQAAPASLSFVMRVLNVAQAAQSLLLVDTQSIPLQPLVHTLRKDIKWLGTQK